MPTPILAAKLTIPPRRPNMVSRPRLIERMNEGLQRKLTLISAPAGFGKTTLATEWASGCGQSVAWLSLDEGDSDLSRFLTYLISALQTLAPEIGASSLSALQSAQPPPTESLLTALLNEIAAMPNNFVLVCDDYHIIESQAVDRALAFLLDHLPPQIHLVIASRIDPSLPLSRLRAGDQMTEICETDLRFTYDETAAFLNDAVGLDLTVEDVAALGARTEGWVVGLQLAAISLQGQQDATSFIQSFTGSHHFVMDYLVDEVLNQQPEDVQSFLLQTAILGRLTGSLCDALTCQGNGQSTLEMLEQTNLFIVPLDEERRWYRYHHLFAELLNQRRRQRLRDQTPRLHARASEWYEQNEYVDEAIEHALHAEDFERATRLIEVLAEKVWAGGVDTKLRNWLARLPAEVLGSRPQLCVFHAWYLLAGGHQDEAEQVIQVIAQGFHKSSTEVAGSEPQASQPQLHADPSMLQGRLATLQAFSAFYRGDVSGIIQSASQALEHLPEQSLSWRSTATHLLGDGYDFSGQMGQAYHARLAAVEASRASGNSVQILITNLKLAIVLRNQGRLPHVTEICERQLALGNEAGMDQTVVVGWLLSIWGETLAETNDLTDAIQKARKGVTLTERGGDIAMLGWSYLCLIRILFSCGDIDGAEAIVHKIDVLKRATFVPPWILDMNAVWQARLWLAQGKHGTAALWATARGLDAHRAPDYQHELENMVFARIQMASGQADDAVMLLQRQLRSAQKDGRISRTIEILILLALALQASGHSDKAMTTLAQALELAEPGGFVRVFVDEGPALGEMLRRVTARGVAPDYTRRLLAAFPDDDAGATLPPGARRSPIELIEPLSPRELEVLQLIARGHSNREICEQLFLALSTVKGYTRTIYGKLAVHRRTEAVARARELGLL